MSADEKWGVGDKASAEPFDAVLVGGERADLITGQYPHSRSSNSHYARFPNGSVVEFDGHRRLVDVRITSRNYLKESGLSGDEIRKAVDIAIFSDQEQVYESFAREPDAALLKAHSLIQQLSGHSSNWLSKRDREALVGRPIFYREVPAVITRLVVGQGAVIISTADGASFPPPVYLDRGEDHEREATIKDDVLSPNIWWFRGA